ncbi:lymphocyte antigen 6E-like [Bufo bufo]|uniref:lymphocyte antigen 6E-like n=1 Tax=Bufo bufo TaxID=8384 RepID=UPI001ABEDB35|nr:lymphocyte antigen 6E-like [Bufo bufo]
MAAYTSLLLVIALCAATAHSLQCYTCVSATTNANCQTAANCTNGQTYCETSVTSVSVAGISATSITKTCAVSCTPTSGGFIVGSASVSCCSTDLCNTSGGASIKSSYAAIILALGSILTILKSSVL